MVEKDYYKLEKALFLSLYHISLKKLGFMVKMVEKSVSSKNFPKKK